MRKLGVTSHNHERGEPVDTAQRLCYVLSNFDAIGSALLISIVGQDIMKTFWAVFFAILAAAAVIWGVWSVSESRSKQRETDMKYAKEAVNDMREIASAAEVGTELPEVLFTTLDIRLTLIRSAVRNQGSRLQHEKQTFIRDGRDLVTALQKRSDRKDWVQRFSAELDAFERDQ